MGITSHINIRLSTFVIICITKQPRDMEYSVENLHSHGRDYGGVMNVIMDRINVRAMSCIYLARSALRNISPKSRNPMVFNT